MPRIPGPSSCTTVARIRRSPRASSVRTWPGLSPIRLRVRVILSFLLDKNRLLGLRGTLAPEPLKILELPDPPEGVERRLQHVVRVVRAERLGEDVLDARRLEHGPDRAAGDQARALRRRAQEHSPGAEMARDLAGERRVAERDVEQVLLGVLDRLPDRLGHLVGLAETHAHVPAPVPP